MSARDELCNLKDFVRNYEQEGVQQLQQLNKLIQNALNAQQKEDIVPSPPTATTLSPLIPLPPTEDSEDKGDGWDEDFGGFGDDLSENQDEDAESVKISETTLTIPNTAFDHIQREHNLLLEQHSTCVDALRRLNNQLCTLSPDDFLSDSIENPADFVGKIETFVSSLHSRFLRMSDHGQASSEEIDKLKEKIENDHKLFTELEEVITAF